MDTSKTGSVMGAERRRIGGGWVVARDRDEQRKSWRWTDSVGGWRKGKDIDSEGNWGLVDSSEQVIGRESDGERH